MLFRIYNCGNKCRLVYIIIGFNHSLIPPASLTVRAHVNGHNAIMNTIVSELHVCRAACMCGSSPCGGTSSLLVMAHHPIGFSSPDTRLHQKSWLLSCSKPSYRNRALYPGDEGRSVKTNTVSNALHGVARHALFSDMFMSWLFCHPVFACSCDLSICKTTTVSAHRGVKRSSVHLQDQLGLPINITAGQTH